MVGKEQWKESAMDARVGPGPFKYYFEFLLLTAEYVKYKILSGWGNGLNWNIIPKGGIMRKLSLSPPLHWFGERKKREPKSIKGLDITVGKPGNLIVGIYVNICGKPSFFRDGK